MASPARIILSGLFTLLMTPAMRAQNSDQSAVIEQSRLFDRSGVTRGANITPDGMALPNEGSSGDDSFGVQQVLKNREPVREWIVAGDASVFYTSNVALTRSGTVSDGVGVVDGSISWVPKIGRELQLQVGGRASIFRYFDTTALNFENLGAGIGLNWIPQNCLGIGFFGRYDFTELLDTHSREILSDHEWTLGAQKTFVFGRAHALSLGLVTMAGVSDPYSEQRDQLGAFAGYHLQLTRQIDLDVFYRVSGYFYNKNDRRDVNQVVSANIAYHLTNWASLAAFVSFGDNRSNHGVFDYDVFTSGGGVGLSIRF